MASNLEQLNPIMQIWNGLILGSPMSRIKYKDTMSNFIDDATNTIKGYKAGLWDEDGHNVLASLAGSDGLFDLMSRNAWQSATNFKLTQDSSYILGISNRAQVLLAAVRPSPDISESVMNRLDVSNFIDLNQGLLAKDPETNMLNIDRFATGSPNTSSLPIKDYLLYFTSNEYLDLTDCRIDSFACDVVGVDSVEEYVRAVGYAKKTTLEAANGLTITAHMRTLKSYFRDHSASNPLFKELQNDVMYTGEMRYLYCSEEEEGDKEWSRDSTSTLTSVDYPLGSLSFVGEGVWFSDSDSITAGLLTVVDKIKVVENTMVNYDTITFDDRGFIIEWS